MARTTKQDQVRELQRTLYRAAKADPKRRFHALYDKVHRRDVLERAWDQVRANRGAAGIDRQTIADVEEYDVEKLLDELERDLRDGSYRTLPARRVSIPKPGRPTEQRPLSIPAVRDRIVQAAVKTVIEPIFEADFAECSYGFRPRRSAHARTCFSGDGRNDGEAADAGAAGLLLAFALVAVDAGDEIVQTLGPRLEAIAEGVDAAVAIADNRALLFEPAVGKFGAGHELGDESDADVVEPGPAGTREALTVGAERLEAGFAAGAVDEVRFAGLQVRRLPGADFGIVAEGDPAWRLAV